MKCEISEAEIKNNTERMLNESFDKIKILGDEHLYGFVIRRLYPDEFDSWIHDLVKSMVRDGFWVIENEIVYSLEDDE